MAEITLEAALDEDLSAAVDERLARIEDDSIVPRIWARDHTVWGEQPIEIVDRLGWLSAPHASRQLVPELRAFAAEAAADGLTHAVLMGMGGSSLAPEVFRRTFGVAAGALDLRVLDSTHPDAIVALEEQVPLDRTLFVASSKSGTTIETRSHLSYFRSLVTDPRRFAVVTDPGTPLERLAHEEGFRRTFVAPPDVGGRYSALTVFGLLPLALIGADIEAVLGEAADAADACGGGHRASANPGAALGAVMGVAAVGGRDKLTLRADDRMAPLGAWIEQLIAESTGKGGTGIVPVDLEPDAVTGPDRLVLALGDASPPEPWSRLPLAGLASVGAATFVLEFATAVAGYVLGVHPFDQPDVQAAKDRTTEALRQDAASPEPQADIDALLAEVSAAGYVGIQAFVPPSDQTWDLLQHARQRMGKRTGAATTLGYGPRYLHSTGQLHKGGPPSGVFLQVMAEPREDRPVPGEAFTFGRLLRAQADGDLAALRERGRHVGRVTLDALQAWGG
ncbi:MAG: glucose-6-phosphate isomerase [Actinomycetota bacterium]|nr:glucose-6-phosphate isomerase [Actinomycetota bacterium]